MDLVNINILSGAEGGYDVVNINILSGGEGGI